jgi:hypothetical protein
MQNQLSTLLETFTRVQVIVRPKNSEHFITLFDHEENFEVEINGHWSVNAYANSLHQSYKALLAETRSLAEGLPETYSISSSSLLSLSTETRAFKRQYFPGENPKVAFSRISIQYESIEVSDVDKELLKQKVEQFIAHQARLLRNLIELFDRYSKMLAKLSRLKDQHNTAMLSGTTAPDKHNPQTLFVDLKWDGTVTEFIELYDTLHEVRLVSRRDGMPLMKKDMFSSLGNTFNVKTRNFNTLKNATQNRKIEKGLFARLSEAIQER